MIEFVPIADIRPSPRNSRKHSPEQVMQIALSMLQWGWTMPVLTDEDGEAIAGHGRVMAAALIYSGFEHEGVRYDPQKIKMANGAMIPLGCAPVMTAVGWSDAQKRAYIIADNRLTEASEWDDDMLRIELADLAGEGFDLALTGMDGDDLQRLSIGVSELAEMPALADGERSPFREQTFILTVEQQAVIGRACDLAATALPADIKGTKISAALVEVCREYIERRADGVG